MATICIGQPCCVSRLNEGWRCVSELRTNVRNAKTGPQQHRCERVASAVGPTCLDVQSAQGGVPNVVARGPSIVPGPVGPWVLEISWPLANGMHGRLPNSWLNRAREMPCEAINGTRETDSQAQATHAKDPDHHESP